MDGNEHRASAGFAALATNGTILLAAFLLTATTTAWAEKKYGPGVTDTEIKSGNTNPYSGNASAYGQNGRAEAAYYRMINDQGGINGRKIVFISLDDAYSPLPGRDLAKVLALVKKNRPKKPLQRISGLSPEAQLQAEDENNRKCIEYGRANLAM